MERGMKTGRGSEARGQLQLIEIEEGQYKTDEGHWGKKAIEATAHLQNDGVSGLVDPTDSRSQCRASG